MSMSKMKATMEERIAPWPKNFKVVTANVHTSTDGTYNDEYRATCACVQPVGNLCAKHHLCVWRENRRECNKDHHECTNQRLTRREWAPLELVWDLAMPGGRGVALGGTKAVKAGTLLTEFVGPVVDESGYMEYEATKSESDPRYAMRLSKSRRTYIVAEFEGNIASFINHSCNPSARAERWTAEGRQRVGIFAIRNIKAGDLITFDYESVQGGFVCKCRAKTCRKIIGKMLETEPQSGNSGRSSSADEEPEETEDLWQPKSAVDAYTAIATVTRQQIDKHKRRLIDAQWNVVTMPADHNCQFHAMVHWMQGGKGYGNQQEARNSSADGIELAMRSDPGIAKRLKGMFGVEATAYLKQIRKSRWGDLFTLQAFSTSNAAEVTVLDPNNEAAVVVSAVGLERIRKERRFTAENVPSAGGAGPLNHYNVLERAGGGHAPDGMTPHDLSLIHI